MSSSTSSSRDIIQISLGPSANAVTAHLLNLQGLAATQHDDILDDNSSPPVCDAQTSHFVENSFLVPRAILVDEASQVASEPFNQQPSPDSLLSAFSGNRVEILDPSAAISAYESPLANFLNTASVLAYNSHSRYYQPPKQQDAYRASSNNPRHVVWDDAEPEEEEEEEDPEARKLRLQRERSQWHHETKEPLQEKLIEGWKEADESLLTWNDFWMPPYSQKSKLALPYSHQSTMSSHWDQYTTTQELDAWREEELSERLRHLLEDSDYCQGFTITTEGYGIYAGLTNSLLLEMQEECKSAGRLVYHVTNPEQRNRNHTEDTSTNDIENENPLEPVPAQSSAGWHSDKVERVRSYVQNGMVLSDFAENSTVVLPLHLPEGESLFRSSARIAMALESATLPFRLNARVDPRYKIGLINAPFFGQGGADSRWGTTAQTLSFGEYLSLLRPSQQHMLVELEAMAVENRKDAELFDHLKLGTSVERDQRMRDEGQNAITHRPRQVLPGGWLQDTSQGGLLSSLSLEHASDRSSHYHFALSAAIRPDPLLHDESQGMSQYLTCLVEGMGIRYRPERSISTVLNQSFSQLVGDGSGSGVYWNSLQKHAPVVAVLGNTTRMYHYTEQIASEMKQVFSLNFRGLYNRDVMHGVLPELEDAQEALSRCYDIRDAYHPPGYDGDDADIDI
jgi:hypothetical protein